MYPSVPCSTIHNSHGSNLNVLNRGMDKDIQWTVNHKLGFPGGLYGKESACSVGDLGLIPGLGSFPGEGDGNPLQFSCLDNSMDIGAWWDTVYGMTKSWTCLSD